ncbi:type II toxin-antitoxin system RelE/ParE family toxin [Parasphingopyxis sp. GrpM-11]|uniref:Type II toxin-antitoxin system RelE/ParE family toxin n=2 Tax=Parasphingopyxis marina TaxID=2761622 RepID=A0A842HYM6_9SPHN|nr:type II toxin-antitoxin system RelE/ParE family toxin [Parasphingopyxis marina]
MNRIEQTEAFENWLDGLGDRTAQKAIARHIVKMEGGLFGDAKLLEGKVWEARIHHGPGYRLYYARKGDRIYLLLCGGTKRRQQKDIERAVALAAQI